MTPHTGRELLSPGPPLRMGPGTWKGWAGWARSGHGRAAGAYVWPLTLFSPHSPLLACDHWSKLDCSLSAPVTKHTSLHPGTTPHPASASDETVESMAVGVHAEITGAVDHQTQEGPPPSSPAPPPQTTDPGGFLDQAGLPIWFRSDPGQCSPVSFGNFLLAATSLSPHFGKPAVVCSFLLTPQLLPQATPFAQKACPGSLLETAESWAPPQNHQGPAPRNLR